jgi:hypothetical protein
MDCEPAQIFNRIFRKARKPHKCCECGDEIVKGERYEYVTMLFDGRWSEYKTCLPCYHIGDDLGCRCYGDLYEAFWDAFGWDYREDPSEWDDDEEE